jgi:O-antigen/teichoic acid export membrane protein
MTGYLGLLDMGVRGAVTRYVAKFHTRDDHQEVGRIASSALVIFTAAGLAAICASVALAVFAISHVQIPATFQTAARIVFVITGLNIAISLVGGVFGGIVVGLQRFDISNAIEMLGLALRAIAIVIILKARGGLVSLALIQLFFSLVTGLANVWVAGSLYPQLRLRLSGVDRERLSLIFSFSIYAFLLQLAVYLIFYTDSVVIAVFLPVGAVTFFAIAGNLMVYARAPISAISYTLSPLASSLEAAGNHPELQRVAMMASRYATAVMLPIAITFLLRGKSFIGLWMGSEYANLSGQVLSILTLAWLFSAGNGVVGAILLGISKHKALVPVGLAEALCNLGLSIVLVHSMGILGVAWGTTLPSLAVHLFVWPWYIHRSLGMTIPAYLYSAWVRPAVAVVPFALATGALEHWWPAANLRIFFFQVVLVLPLVLIGYWFLIVDDRERRGFVENYVLTAARALRGL